MLQVLLGVILEVLSLCLLQFNLHLLFHNCMADGLCITALSVDLCFQEHGSQGQQKQWLPTALRALPD